MTTAIETKIDQDETLTNVQIAFSQEVETTVMPLLQKMKETSADPLRTKQLIDILEKNIQHLVRDYGCDNSLVAAYQRLTPVEILVASLIRQGLATKVMATVLHISPGTVSIHRKHIRKKLGLQGSVTNLHSYLKSLAE
jgi:FixJ family two-component response regulator